MNTVCATANDLPWRVTTIEVHVAWKQCRRKIPVIDGATTEMRGIDSDPLQYRVLRMLCEFQVTATARYHDQD